MNYAEGIAYMERQVPERAPRHLNIALLLTAANIARIFSGDISLILWIAKTNLPPGAKIATRR
jgi:hypothetical protein